MSPPEGAPETTVQLKPGQILRSRYKIRRFIGAGGMAEIYEAYDELLHRPVAIKILDDGAMARGAKMRAQLLKRFFREARIAARISHPNAVTIFDMGVALDRSLPFIVMELIEGHDLERELTTSGPMSARRALTLMEGCLEALGEAHRRGIVHKDLKPSNLMLSEPGTPHERLLILDFGVARAIRKDARLTSDGQAFGTPQYMAPEYISAQEVTPALDVYQMALILIEMMTGTPVVDHKSPLQCMVIHGKGTLDLPESIMTGALGTALKDALAHDHTARLQDADALRTALLEASKDLAAFTTRHSIKAVDLQALGRFIDPAPTLPSPQPDPKAPSPTPKAQQTPTPTILGGPPRRPDMPTNGRLIVYRDRQPVQSIDIVHDETLIGRYDPDKGAEPDIDLTEHDPERLTSRRHAYIYRVSGQHYIYPISNSGTQVGDTLVPMGQRHKLHHGDIIVLAAAIAIQFQHT